jgi:hypothetical protein
MATYNVRHDEKGVICAEPRCRKYFVVGWDKWGIKVTCPHCGCYQFVSGGWGPADPVKRRELLGGEDK